MRGFSIVFKMAFRNVLKYGRRSAGTFAVVFIGVAAICLTDAFVNGFSDRIISEFAVASGHLRASAPGYAARRATCPLDRLVDDPEALARAAAAAVPGRGLAVLPLLRAPCMAQSGDRSVDLYIAGADPYLAGGAFAPPYKAARFEAGAFPARGEKGLVLSAKTASRLGASVGDPIVLLANDAYGSFGAIETTLVGISRGDPGTEGGLLDLESMRGLLGVERGAAEVALYLVDESGRPVDPRSASGELAAIEASAKALGLEVERWDSSSALVAMLPLFDGFIFALFAIFAAVAGTGVANSVLLSIQDRTRDFGTLRAVAFTKGWVRAIVAMETLFIGASASIAAALASLGAIAAMGEGGLRIPEASRGIAEWMPELIPARVDSLSLVFIVAAGSLFPLLAASYPMIHLGRMKIREALGYV